MFEFFSSVFSFKSSVLHSSTKSLDGLLEGTYLYLGDYDQCLAIRYQNNENTEQGQYALLEMVPSKVGLSSENGIHSQLSKVFADPLFKLRFAVCLPSACTSDDVRQLFKPSNYIQKCENNFINCNQIYYFFIKNYLL